MSGPMIMDAAAAHGRCTIRSGRWPRPRATTTPSAGGTTSSSPGCDGSSPFPVLTEAMAELRPLRTTRRGAVREAAPRGVHAADASGPRSSGAASGSRWSAAPGTPRRWPGRCRRRRPTRGILRGTAQAQGAADLGALDPRAAGQQQRLRRRASPRPGWYHHLWTAPDQPIARWLTKVAACPADQGLIDLQRARDRGGPARRDPGRACAAGRWPGWPRSTRRPGPCSATATRLAVRLRHRPSGRRSGPRLGQPRRADGAAGGRPGRDLPDAC